MFNHPFSEEFHPDVQLEAPLAQLEAISTCPITCFLGKETNPLLPIPSFQVIVESYKVTPKPPFLQAKPPQLPQLLLIRLVLQNLPQICCLL